MITNNTSQYFLACQGLPGFGQASCTSLFYDRFYSRLFDMHPLSRPMFSAGLKSQGKFLVQMMSMVLNLADKDNQFDDAMIKLAEVHNERGVKAFEYGIVGEVLFWTLKECLGPEYDRGTHRVWVKLFSRMLSVIVPHAVAYEIAMGSSHLHQKRLAQSSKKAANREPDESSNSKDVSSPSHSTGLFARLSVFHSGN